jgi:hypothetical protein
MSGVQISEEQIAAMYHQERRELIMRLARASSTIVPVPMARRIRRRRLALYITAVLVLLPWIVYLALSLPTTTSRETGPRPGWGLTCCCW